MLATVTLQFRTANFLASMVAELQNHPPCPPASMSGVQVQRIRVTQASLRQDKAKDFDVFMGDGGERVGSGAVAHGFQTQILLQTDVSVTTDNAIAGNPGGRAPALANFKPVVVYDLTGFFPPLLGIG